MRKTEKIFHGDCLEIMKDIESESVDMILCDLPYGTTACKWDSIIPFEPLWKQYERIIKTQGAIVLTASQPFTSALVMSKPNLFRYELIWEKTLASNFVHANYQPLKAHENILVFSKSGAAQGTKTPMRYNPQLIAGVPYNKGISKKQREGLAKGLLGCDLVNLSGDRKPRSVNVFSNADRTNQIHPTQKPLALFEWLIKTYTNEGDVVMDNCAGSGTTAIACLNTNRHFIVIEKEYDYYFKMWDRIEQTVEKLSYNGNA